MRLNCKQKELQNLNECEWIQNDEMKKKTPRRTGHKNVEMFIDFMTDSKLLQEYEKFTKFPLVQPQNFPLQLFESFMVILDSVIKNASEVEKIMEINLMMETVWTRYSNYSRA